jgi:hypothetical protein
VLCAERCDITQPSSHITNTGSGADAGRVPHWPHPRDGASSSATSTTAWSPAVGTSVGDADATAVVAAAIVSFRCGPVATAVSRGGSPVATALAAARGALNERRLVVTGAPDLSALAGERVGTIGVTLRTKRHKDEHQPLEIKGARGECCSPQVREALLPLPRGLGGAAVAPTDAAMALASASVALAGFSAGTPAAGASTPAAGANSTAALRPVVTGVGDSTSRGAPPSLSSSSSSSDDGPASVPRGESPCCSCNRYSSLCCSRCSRRLILHSFARVARSCSCHCAARAAARARGVGGSDRVASTVTICS